MVKYCNIIRMESQMHQNLFKKMLKTKYHNQESYILCNFYDVCMKVSMYLCMNNFLCITVCVRMYMQFVIMHV